MKNLIHEARTLLVNATPNTKFLPLESQQVDWAQRFGKWWASTAPEVIEGGLGQPVGDLARWGMSDDGEDADFVSGWNKALCLAEAHIEDIGDLREMLAVFIALDEKGRSPSNDQIEQAKRLLETIPAT
jgi:hypothetical protein